MLRFLIPGISLAFARSYWSLMENYRISMNVNHALSRTVLPTAFELAEGTVRTSQIAFAMARDDDDIADSRLCG
ncbi:hypothetical protein JQ629_20295 [Bradyrhizobium sp. AUGA SZCCT0222]|uniref:hypothetical protein n=1 Tax=Bradyrhizobium sp. AUGA SZCCT0222 TaxID=2807668 RepID=UPI001BA446C4|nr:hypothetical protein [Bradyrhizobium sp. AUGA SZCCT0222]MBR1269859.1 hypothetical protein [Bradyrhizobium sp. AUGA SZCCT0222]